MRKKRDDTPGSIDDERRALFEQRRALEDLKRQLAEHVAAVQEREAELRRAIAQAQGGVLPGDLAALPTAIGNVSHGHSLPAVEADPAAARELERLRLALEQREEELGRREVELDRRARAVTLPAPRPSDSEERLAELRAAEQAFLRTREELSARAEAVAAREHLVAERERELRSAEGVLPGDDLQDLEARLRRLESQRAAAASQSFTGGIRRLERGGTRRTP